MNFSVPLADSAKHSAEQLLELLSKAYKAGKEFIVVSHARDDFDSKASIQAVLVLLNAYFGVNARVYFDYPSAEAWIIPRTGTIADLREHLQDQGRNNVCLILVDANDINASHVNSHWEFYPLSAPDVVVDHHPIVGRRTAAPKFEIRVETAASAVGLLLEVIEVAFAEIPEMYGTPQFVVLATLALRAMPNDVGLEVGDVKTNLSVLGPRGERYWPEMRKRADWELLTQLDSVDPRFAAAVAYAEDRSNQIESNGVIGYFIGVFDQNDIDRLMARIADKKARCKETEGKVIVVLAYIVEGFFVRAALRQHGTNQDLEKIVTELIPSERDRGGRRNAAFGKQADPYFPMIRYYMPMLAAFWSAPKWFSLDMLKRYVQRISELIKTKEYAA